MRNLTFTQDGKEIDISEYSFSFKIKPEVKPEYKYEQFGHVAYMPSGACIIQQPEGVLIIYKDETARFISDTWYDNVNTDRL